MEIDWEKHHYYMPLAGLCGPSVVKMVLSATGIKKSIIEISFFVYKFWYGSPRDLIFGYLSKFYRIVNFKTSAKISDISFHIKQGHIVILNWFDDLGDGDADGHYSIAAKCEKGKITLVDPSNQRDGIWSMSTKEFNSRWFDYIDLNNRTYSEGYIIWVDPKSKR
jgi:hypothetical protein